MEGLALMVERRQRPAAIEELKTSELTPVCSVEIVVQGVDTEIADVGANGEGIALYTAVERKHAPAIEGRSGFLLTAAGTRLLGEGAAAQAAARSCP